MSHYTYNGRAVGYWAEALRERAPDLAKLLPLLTEEQTAALQPEYVELARAELAKAQA